jgi:Ca2+-binding EF-hand superfamily protein
MCVCDVGCVCAQLADPLSRLHLGVSPDELVNAHATVREKLLLRHDTIHKAFKYMDKDGSGFINRSEFESTLNDLNVVIRKPVLDSLLDIIDVEDNDDGDEDHDIGFREL